MIPEMAEEKFMPLFKNSIMKTAGLPHEKHSFIKGEEPLVCQVLSTASSFVISDGHHKVGCKFSKEAIIELKVYYPKVNIKDLDKQYIILRKYAPHTFIRKDDQLELSLHIYCFTLHGNRERNKGSNIQGRPTDLSSAEYIKENSYLEKSKHLTRLLNIQKGAEINKLPPLEDYLWNKGKGNINNLVVPFNAKVMMGLDELEKELLNYKKIEKYEKYAVVEAHELLVKEKEVTKKYKEKARKWAEQRKAKPRSLGKELNKLWADIQEKKAARPKPAAKYFVKGEIAEFIAKRNNHTEVEKVSLRSLSKQSIDKAGKSRRGTEIKPNSIASEMKTTAGVFKKFMSWKAGIGKIDREATNVTEVLKKTKVGSIKLNCEVPTRPAKKAFTNWASAETPGKKRFAAEGITSAKKSTKKGKYGPI